MQITELKLFMSFVQEALDLPHSINAIEKIEPFPNEQGFKPLFMALFSRTL
jgi:hypothetical protein